MAAPLLLVAVLLSLFVLYARSAADFPNHAVPSSRTRLFRAALLVATFVFSGMVILARYEHDKELSGLITLVRSHTPRDAILTIVTSADPTLAAESVRLQELLDRPIRVVETFSTSARLRGNFCLTSGGLPPGWRLVARLEPPTAANATVMARALDWFSQHIARRKKGDKLELPAVCGLYRGDGEGAPAPSTAMPRALLPSAASPSAPKP